MGNLKNAVRAQWRPEFDLVEDRRTSSGRPLANLRLLLGLLLLSR